MMDEVDEPVNLFAQQDANRRRSRWLIFAFIAFFAWLGFGGDFLFFQLSRGAEEGAYRHNFPSLGLAMTALAAGLAWWAWKTGPEKVLWSAGAQELTHAETPEERQILNIVEEMAVASGLPRPRVWIIEDADPNTFATGRDPAASHIAVTRGLLHLCSRDELQAVIGHEMGHVKNLDVKLATLLAGLVGAVALLHDGVGRMLRGGDGFRLGRVVARGGKGRGKGGGPIFLALLVLWLASWALAPVVTRLLAMGVSRKREYLADAMSAQYTRNPLALASALEKIERAAAPTAAIKQGSAHLCIADPLGRKVGLRQGVVADLLATHPPMALRVARLRAMGYQAQKRAAEVGSA